MFIICGEMKTNHFQNENKNVHDKHTNLYVHTYVYVFLYVKQEKPNSIICTY